MHRNDSGSNVHQVPSDRSASMQSTNSFLSWFGYHGHSSDNNSNNGLSRKASADTVDRGPSFSGSNRQNSMTPSEKEDERHYQVFIKFFN